MKKSILILFCLSFSVVAFGQVTTWTVTKTTDPDPLIYMSDPDDPIVQGTLQWAVRKSNATTGLNRIEFNLPGQGPHTIELVYVLPAIVQQVEIDGSTQPGYTSSRGPEIVIDGGYSVNIIFLFNSFNGNYSIAENSLVKALELKRSTSNAILVWSDGVDVIDCVIHSNGLSGSVSGSCVYFYGDENIARGNVFGTDFGKTEVLPNYGAIGIQEMHSGKASDNLVQENYTAYSGKYYIMGAGHLRNTFTENLFVDNEECSGCEMSYAGAPIQLHYLSPAPSNNSKQPPSLNLSGLTLSGTSAPYDLIELFGATKGFNANTFLGTETADASGNWTYSIPNSPTAFAWPYISVTATDPSGNTSEMVNTCVTNNVSFAAGVAGQAGDPNSTGEPCTGQVLSFHGTLNGDNYQWDFGDGTFSYEESPVHIYNVPGPYVINVTYTPPTGCPAATYSFTLVIQDCMSCANCVGSFAPEAGEYLIQAWTKEAGTGTESLLTYPSCSLQVSFTGNASVYTFSPSYPENPIIDGWQRVEGRFTIPASASDIHIALVNSGTNETYFDDIRIHPVNSTAKSYVFDPLTLRLSAELDENNYATYYEYDEEGKLVRVKKETVRGVLTIKESRNSQDKTP